MSPVDTTNVFRRQRGEFLNRYEFAYDGRDTVSQAMKGLDTLAAKLIKQISGEVDRLAKNRISQIINEGGRQKKTQIDTQTFQMMSQGNISHGCLYVNKDTIRVLINSKNGEQFLLPTNKSFWGQPEDCTENRNHTRNSNRRRKKRSVEYIRNYLNNIN